ncbi:MAG TPA: hypothetical protein VG347_23830 [Verrucomicrobiae bacterium]|nr:hypothetical protein [Verrucomicrobiae bacterium]
MASELGRGIAHPHLFPLFREEKTDNLQFPGKIADADFVFYFPDAGCRNEATRKAICRLSRETGHPRFTATTSFFKSQISQNSGKNRKNGEGNPRQNMSNHFFPVKFWTI